MVYRRITLVSFLVLVLGACGHAAVASPVSAGPDVLPSGATLAPRPPTGAAEPLTGTQRAFLRSADVGKRTITFDLVEWFEGAAAVAACKADGEEPAENDWCTGWYIRNKNSRLRTYPVVAGASLRIIGATASESVTVSLKKFRATLLQSGGLFAFTVKAGRITSATEVYTP